MMNTKRGPGGRGRLLNTAALTFEAVSADPTQNRAVILGEQSSREPVPNFSDDEPLIVGQFSDEERGLDALSLLAVGVADTSATGLSARYSYGVQEHEWGLGINSFGVYCLVAGGPRQVDWKKLPDLTPIAHTHPYKPVDLKDINKFFGQNFTSLADVLNYWLDGKEVIEVGIPELKYSEQSFDYMPGGLSYLFPSDVDLTASFTCRSQRPEIVCAPFRIGEDGWLSRNEGPTLGVEFGPVYAVLQDSAAETIKASKGIQFHSDPEQLLSKCVRAYVTQATFGAKGLRNICTGWQSSNPHVPGVGRYERNRPPEEIRMTREEVYDFIKKNLGLSRRPCAIPHRLPGCHPRLTPVLRPRRTRPACS